MSSKQPTTNSQLPDRLYGEHYPDSFLDVPGPVRTTSVATLGDYIRQLREVDKQPDQPCVACVAPQSGESNFQHICPNNPILTCNCANPNTCPELGANPDGNQTGNEDRCPNHDGFADNIEYTHIDIQGPPLPAGTEGENDISGWPCVVVGAVHQTWVNSAKLVPDPNINPADADRNVDAGPSDGSYVSTNH